MMHKPWLAHYPPGVPAEIDYREYSSVVALMEQAFDTHRAREAYVCMGKALSFGDIDGLSRVIAAWLQKNGLNKGDRVAVMLPNVLQYPVAVAGILRAGGIVVNVNPLYTARELEHQLKDSGARIIIVLENFAHTLEQVIARTAVEKVIVTGLGDLLGFPKSAVVNVAVRHLRKMVPAYTLPGHTRFNEALAQGKTIGTYMPPQISVSDIAVLQYTGGTTGVSKGAVLLHGTLIANLLSSEAWMQPGLKKRQVAGQHTLVCALPLYHVFAFVTCGLLGMRMGARNILIPNPRDLDTLIRALRGYRIHAFPGVNTLFNGLLHHPGFKSLDFSELLITNGGGMAVQDTVAGKWLATTGCPVVEGYGLSETSSGVTCNPVDAEAFSGTVGLPLPSALVRITDDAGSELPPGQPGEIEIKGPQVMAGYWNRPDETAKAMTPDGWLKSGDIGIMDERGYLKIVDRKKDMILVSGFNVYPNEIENVAAAHPGVLECAAIAVPDAGSGEAVKLFVVRQDPGLTEDALIKYCATQLAGYKRPKTIEFRSDLPKSNVGKILRRELREAAERRDAAAAH